MGPGLPRRLKIILVLIILPIKSSDVPIKKCLHVTSPFSIYVSTTLLVLYQICCLSSTEGLPNIFGALLYIFVIIVMAGASKPNIFPFNVTGTLLC